MTLRKPGAWKAALLLAAVAVPAAAGPLSAAEAPAGDAGKPAPEKPKDAVPHERIILSLGHMSQEVDGNRRRFRQYITPPSGTHLSLLGVVHPLDKHGLAFETYGYDLFQPGVGATARVYQVDTGLRLDSRYRRSRFFRDFDPVADPLRRADWETDLRWRASPHNYVRTYYATLRERGGDLANPLDNFTSRRVGVSYHRAVGAFDASAAWDTDHFRFPVPGPSALLTGDRNAWSVGLSRGRSSGTLLAAGLATATTSLRGFGVAPRETTATFVASHELAPGLTVNLDAGLWQLANSITQNAHAKTERRVRVETEWSGLPRTVLRGALETANLGYVKGDLSATVQPTVTTSTLGLRSRPWRFLKLDADFRRRRTSDRPLSAPVLGLSGPTLAWAQVDRTRVRASFTPRHAQYGLTAGWMSDRRENPAEGARNQIILRDATAWWAVSSHLTATASAMNQSFGLRGAGPTGNLLSDSHGVVINATWQADRHTTVSSSYARSASSGSFDLSQRTWTFSFERALKEQRLRLGLTLDNLADKKGAALGYDADLWFAEFSTSLP